MSESPSEPGAWLAIHVFYGGNARPMLVQCVRPLIDELTAQGRLAGYFFINYWLEGPHLRLRLKPRTAADEPAVRAAAEAAINRYLAERPALYDMNGGYRGELYNTLFALEFPHGKPAELVDADGNMVIQPNNCYRYRAYEPEYGKYGGPDGIALAEWHFQHSSDLVIEAVRTMNMHMRPVALGTAIQLMLVLSRTFVPDRTALVGALDDYHRYWHSAFAGTDFVDSIDYAQKYESIAGDLDRRFDSILPPLDRGEPHLLPAFLRGWAEHTAELRERVIELAVSGRLRFAYPEGAPAVAVTDPERALTRLLHPYMHMTNNRLYVTLRDEAYLSYMLGHALRDAARDDDTVAA